MKYVVESELYNFPAWSGGKQRLDDLVKHDRAYDTVADYLEMAQAYGEDNGKPWSECDVNDWLWFEMDEYLKEEGFKDEDGDWIDGEEE